MTSPRMTIVVGAGASKEFGLPLGSELKDEIANLLNIEEDELGRCASGDRLLLDLFKPLANSKNTGYTQYLEAARTISKAMPQAPSIDNFIDIRRGDKDIELCGKLAICRSILKSERDSKIFTPEPNRPEIDFKRNQHTWLNAFMQIVTEGADEQQLADRLRSISFVIFNYDRCVEHFIYHWLINCYGISSNACAALMRHINISHPYGSIAPLPWQGHQDHVAFGETIGADRLLNAIAHIRTFTEGTDSSSEALRQIRSAIARCDQLVFLGFAFHKLNMELLFSEESGFGPQYRHEQKGIFATTFGFSTYNTKALKEQLSKLTKCENVHLQPTTSNQLFYEYARAFNFRD